MVIVGLHNWNVEAFVVGFDRNKDDEETNSKLNIWTLDTICRNPDPKYKMFAQLVLQRFIKSKNHVDEIQLYATTVQSAEAYVRYGFKTKTQVDENGGTSMFMRLNKKFIWGFYRHFAKIPKKKQSIQKNLITMPAKNPQPRKQSTASRKKNHDPCKTKYNTTQKISKKKYMKPNFRTQNTWPTYQVILSLIPDVNPDAWKSNISQIARQMGKKVTFVGADSKADIIVIPDATQHRCT